MFQEELFERPKKRGPRGWTELDRLRALVERLNRRIAETGGCEKDFMARDAAETRLIQAEEEARKKWKNSFGN